MPDTKHVYHLCGSPTSQFFYDLSIIYARNVCTPKRWESTFLAVDWNGKWYLGDTVDTLGKGGEAKDILPSLLNNSLIVPHIFCLDGMTLLRGLFEKIFGFPLVGSSGEVMRLASDKARAREMVARGGVNIARGETASYFQASSIPMPVVVKPNGEDNSLGLSLVEAKEDLPQAIKKAENYDPVVLVEEFIPGREVRLALIEEEQSFLMPAVIEYAVSEQNPIRKTNDKLIIGSNGVPQSQAVNSRIQMTCPAKLSSEVREELQKQAIAAHKALGARDFSLFDFRIDQRSGKPVFLEAGLFWSFSPESMITKMLSADGLDIQKLIDELWSRALKRGGA